MTPKQYIEEREEEFNQFKCIQSGCDNNGTVPDGNGEATACKFCHEFLMPIKEYHSQTIKGLIEVIMEEIENTTQLAINGARKVIVDDYNEATRRYERAGMEIKEGEKYAVNDSLSENSKQVALSRLEPKVTKAINITLSDITTKLKTIIE